MSIMKLTRYRFQTKLFVLSLVLGCLLFSPELFAQPTPDMRPGGRHRFHPGRMQNMSPEKRLALKNKIQEIKMWKLTRRLNLTEEQSARFFPRYNKYQDEVFDNFEKMHDKMFKLRELMNSNGTDKQIDQAVNDILSSQTRNHEIIHKYVKQFREVLSAQQVAELIVFEHDFSRDLRGLLKNAMPPDDTP